MKKTSAKLDRLSRLKEQYGFGALLEKMRDGGEFSQLMGKLRDVDDNVREFSDDLKSHLNNAVDSYNKSKYMFAIAYIGQFHEQFEKIIKEFSSFDKSVDLKHYEFLFEDMDPELHEYFSKKMPERYKGRYQKKEKVSTAGLESWWEGLKKNWSLKIWEKRFPQFSKDLKKNIGNIISKSEQLYSFFVQSLKEMAGLRTSRELEGYIKKIKKIQSLYEGYDKLFWAFYTNYAQKFIQQAQEAQLNKNNNFEFVQPKSQPLSEPIYYEEDETPKSFPKINNKTQPSLNQEHIETIPNPKTLSSIVSVPISPAPAPEPAPAPAHTNPKEDENKKAKTLSGVAPLAFPVTTPLSATPENKKDDKNKKPLSDVTKLPNADLDKNEAKEEKESGTTYSIIEKRNPKAKRKINLGESEEPFLLDPEFVEKLKREPFLKSKASKRYSKKGLKRGF